MPRPPPSPRGEPPAGGRPAPLSPSKAPPFAVAPSSSTGAGGGSVETKGKREKRVRSAARKRGSRGQGGKIKQKQKEKAKELAKKHAIAAVHASLHPARAAPVPGLPSAAMQSSSMPMQPVGMMPPVPMHLSMPSPMTPQSPPKKRKRERKNKHWKPWSEQTWEERLERQKFEERRAAEKEAQQSLPLSKSKKKKRRNEFEMPRAPRNTTQALMHTHGESNDGHQRRDEIGPSAMPSMQGLLSRQSIAHRQWRDDNESSDSDDDDNGKPSLGAAHQMTNGTSAERPHSPHSPQSPMSPVSPPGTPGEAIAALREEQKDRRIQELEAQNQTLLDRLAAFEGATKPPVN